ncbi:MAG: hypothetical protein ACTSUQ_00955, partial [Candidatus Freyarchaeota archaeon]
KPRGEQDGARPSGAKAETISPTTHSPTRKAPGHADTGDLSNQKQSKTEETRLWDNLGFPQSLTKSGICFLVKNSERDN